MKEKLSKLRLAKRIWIFGCVILVSCISLIAVQSRAEQEDGKPTSKVERYFGKRIISILSEPMQTQAFRVDPKVREDWSQGPAIELSAESAAQLKTVFLNEQTYYWEDDTPIGLRCIFQPAVAFRFWKEKEFISVLVCFKCGEIKFLSDNPTENDHNPFSRAVKAKLRPEIVQLTKQLFAEDKVIQGLKD